MKKKPEGNDILEKDAESLALIRKFNEKALKSHQSKTQWLKKFALVLRKIVESQGVYIVQKSQIMNVQPRFQLIVKQLWTVEKFTPKYFAEGTKTLINFFYRLDQLGDLGATYAFYQILCFNLTGYQAKYLDQYADNFLGSIFLISSQISKILEKIPKTLPQQFEIYSYIDKYGELISKLCKVQNKNIDLDRIKNSLLYSYSQKQKNYQIGVLISLSKVYQIMGERVSVNFKDIITMLWENIREQNERVQQNSMDYFCKFVKKFQKKLDEEFKAKLFFWDIIQNVQDKQNKMWACCNVKLFCLVFMRFSDSTLFEPLYGEILRFAWLYLKSPGKIVAVYLFYILSTISRLLDQTRAKRFIQIYFQVFDKQSFPLLINLTCELMTGIFANMQTYFAENFVELVFKKLKELSLKIQFKSLLASWSNICMTGIKVNDWESIFEIILSELEKICLSAQEEAKQVQVPLYKAIQLTSLCYQQDLRDCSPKILQLLFSRLKKIRDSQKYLLLPNLTSAMNKIIQKSQAIQLETNQALVKEMIDFHFKKLIQGRTIMNPRITMCSINSLKEILLAYGNKFNSAYMIQYKKKIRQFLLILRILKQKEKQKCLANSSKFKTGELGGCIRSFVDLLKVHTSLTEDKDIALSRLLQQYNYWINQDKNENDEEPDNYAVTHGLIYINVALETLPFEVTKQHWENFTSLFQKHKQNNQSEVRKYVVLGIASMAMKASIKEVDRVRINEWLSIVKTCQQIGAAEYQSEDDFLCCQDIFVSVLGKIIIRYHHKIGDHFKYLYDEWLEKLPLIHNGQENKFQIQALCEIITNTPEILMQKVDSVDRVVLILKVFCKLKIHTDKEVKKGQVREMLRLIGKTYGAMKNWKILCEKITEIQAKLTKVDKRELTELLKL